MLKLKIYLMIYFAKLFNGFGKVSTSVIYAQAVHETGDFTSPIFKEQNNLFGMRHPSRRKTYSQGTKRAHAYFKTHWDSIRDYFERQKNFSISSEDDQSFMSSTVASNYAEDPNYLQKWQRLAGSVKKPVTGIYIGVLFFSSWLQLL